MSNVIYTHFIWVNMSTYLSFTIKNNKKFKTRNSSFSVMNLMVSQVK